MRHRSRIALIIGSLLILLAGGCALENNPTPPIGEADSLWRITQLTGHSFASAGEACFSRDMNWIIFQATPVGERDDQMFVAQLRKDATGVSGIGVPIRISPEMSRNAFGNFSPDGNSLIFASTASKENPAEPPAGYQRDGRDDRWDFSPEMEIYRADGWQGAVAAAEPGKIVDMAKHPLTANNGYDAECAYSPDGKWIIFCSNSSGDLELYVMRPDGSGVVQLTHSPGYDGGAFFSPDGKRIVFQSDRRREDYLQIFTADLTFDSIGNITGIQKQRELTHDVNSVNCGPYWHPDGRHIIYGTSTHGHTNYELYLMRTDGSRKTRITFTDGADILPVFSPDGKYLIWTSQRSGQSQIEIARFTPPHGS